MLCVQETRWKEQKTRELGEGFKLYYMGVDNRRNGVEVVPRVERVRHPGKDDFWDLLGDTKLKVPEGEDVWITGDSNGHVGEGRRDTEVTGRYGVGTRNEAGDEIVDFTTAKSLAIVNTHFQKRLTRREVMAKQHKLVICKVKMKQHRQMKQTGTRKTRWWKLNEEEHRDKFTQRVETELGEKEKTWGELRTVVRKTAEEILGRTSGKKGKKEETWWWCTEVQEAIKEERQRERDLNRCEETITAYKIANKKAKKEVTKSKSKAYEDLYNSLEGEEGQRKAIRITKQKNRDSKDVYQAKRVKNEDGQVLTDDTQIR
ncbi:uncharacterized protein LOC134788734 [Penaeus indicus]|uniref:uncharacterized protein LOC134788734 n=1 Tax=Penaeus indicus TaxID=29960 RepID=UPI00300D3D2F